LVTIRFSKILIVDDTEIFREKTKKNLSDAKIGTKYYFAKDGREAISQYIAHRPHVVIMDIIMPNLDGVKASQAIMKFDPNAKIIVVSTKDNQNTINAVIKSGYAKDYVFKPCDTSAIIMAVSKILSVKKKVEITT
jgi:two-component system, chemotaxis family, chemotaxis protein CheY